MAIEKLRPTYTFTQDRLEALKTVVPEAFADGKLNWETLREALGNYLEEESADAEHFGLTWPGKRAARRLAATPSKGTLYAAPGEGIDEATTHNLFIEGDNLEVLKLLQKSYAGRVKLIYIDPPYNTGNDFIYKDDFKEPLDSYLRRTGQTGEEGELLTSNPKAGGRFHSNWLNMMYPRLLLARQLLSEEGTIFVSIDDNEVHMLRHILDDTFGEENFVASIIWQKKYSPQNDAKWLSNMHDYVLLYAKNKEFWRPVALERTEEQDKAYKNPDSDIRGSWKATDSTCNKSRTQRPNLYYPIKNPFTNEDIYPLETRVWRYSQSVHLQKEKDNRVWWGPDGKNRVPAYKSFLSEVKQGRVPTTLWNYQEAGHNQLARQELNELIQNNTFDTPKPALLIKRMFQIGTTSEEEDVVLDFFSGSSTTAQAVFEQNREDGGNRRFILVQLPEATNNPQFPTIAEIGKERIRRVIQRMKADSGTGNISANSNSTGLMNQTLFTHAQSDDPDQTEMENQDGMTQGVMNHAHTEDLGFKVLKLGRSHFKRWNGENADDLAQVQTLFDAAESPLVADWQAENLLVEIMLQEGFPLDSQVEVQEFFQQNWVWKIESDACAHRLFVCLDERLHPDTLTSVERISNGIFICLDAALSDEEKLRLSEACRLKVI